MKSFSPFVEVRPKLLVVDDQPLNIRVLNELFRRDCDIYMASSGEEALAMCQSMNPDLILLDVMMEGMDGYEVCKRLKENAETRQIPVIFVTGKSDDSDEEAGFELGAVDYIRKPFNSVVVRARVETHLTLKLQSDYLRAMVMLDGLTGIPNRRAFDDRFKSAWAQAYRDSTPLSLLMIDVDYFKKYNDHYGHLKGDQCLRQVASGLSGEINRPYDLLARFGGEEFVGLLPNTNEKGAVEVAKRMQQAIAALGIDHCSSDINNKITLSIGIATCNPSLQTLAENLLRLADTQLYRAKNEGRNRVCSCTEGS